MINSLLSNAWLNRLAGFNRIIVGFSGGLDSTVLLHILSAHPSLHSRIIAVHVNHGISEHAVFWQNHCEQFCHALDVFFIAKAVEFDRSANIEEGARNARYAVFSSVLSASDCLILGHHMDDQAETLLLQLFRGSGIDGLASMKELSQLGNSWIGRPFLSHSRKELEDYAVANQLHWIDDESNLDQHYSRNYLRHSIMPLLEKKWPSVTGNLVRSASHCQQAQDNLFDLALIDAQELTKDRLHITPLKGLKRARIANVLRAWLKISAIQSPSMHTFNRLIDEAMFASMDAMPLISWEGARIRRYQDYLYIDRVGQAALPASTEWLGFPKPISIANGLIRLSATGADKGMHIRDGARVEIRFRQAGEQLILHGQTKRLKKLMQEWGIPPWLRGSIPLIYVDNQLAAVVGYAISDLFYITNSIPWIISVSTQAD